MIDYPPSIKNLAAVPGLKRLLLQGLLGGGLFLSAFGVHAQGLASVNLAWDPSAVSGIAGYRVYQGVASRTYTSSIKVGNTTTATLTGLTAGQRYYVAVTAIDSQGMESPFSTEISVTPGSTTLPVIALTSPANGASFTAPATLSLAATVTPNGQTITKVQFFNGTTLLAEDTTAPYSYSWGNVGAGNYSLSAKAVYGAGSTVASSASTVAVTSSTTLPAPWQSVDIGRTGLKGSASSSAGVYTVAGAGNLSGRSDNFRFLYQPMSGNGEIRAQISSIQNTSTNARAGVMIRETLTSGSRYAFMGISPDGRFRAQRRSSTGGSTSTRTSGSGTPPNEWVRLVRSGNVFYTYRSTDASNWTLVSSNAITMASNVYVGFAVASGNTNTLNTARFSTATVVP